MHKTLSLATLLLVGILVHGTYAEFMPPTLAPLDRLITNAESYITEHPETANGYYILGRIHYLAFINRAALIPMGWDKETSPPSIAADWSIPDFDFLARHNHAVDFALRELGYADFDEIPAKKREEYWSLVGRKFQELEGSKWQPERLDAAEAIAHATAADRSLRKAIELKPKDGLYYLSLASLMDQFMDFVESTEGVDVPKELAQLTPDIVRDTYYRAYELSIRDDLKRDEMPAAGLPSLVGFEAGQGYIRWCGKIGDLTEEEQKRLTEVRNSLQHLRKLPAGMITPIIFSLEGTRKLAALLAPESSVEFDLDGDGEAGTWPWVKPSTGFLVWDPGETGRITSGRQMFGSVSWWLFFSNGYHALDALDNNRDGRLAGEELAGISVWFDRNTNGRSDPDEVIPIRTLGVTALSTNANGAENGSPMNPAGVILEDGRELPTYDWITSPFDAPAHR